MNFLAHAYLSGDNDKIMVGNFIGDFVKGRQAIELFERDIALGINLHRFIDAFTDTHPVVHESKKRLRAKYRHYANVIVDIFYDHYLASEWDMFHKRPLKDYAQWVYTTIQSHDNILPQGVKHMLPYMTNGNWLFNYRKTEGIARALSGMSQRTTYESKMDEAVEDLINNYDAFKSEFDQFFPLLAARCQSWVREHQPLA
jgi:acyl carrier protein phosphodiesterase